MGLISNGTTIFDAGAMSAGFGGNMTFIKKLTSDGSDATLDFVDGTSDVVLDSTYKEYMFIFKDMHPETVSRFGFQVDTGTNTSYNQTITSSTFAARHTEDNGTADLAYHTGDDLAQGTGLQRLTAGGTVENENDSSVSGTLHLFNPSSTTFVKHFIADIQGAHNDGYCNRSFIGGYVNTTTAITRVQFKYTSDEIQGGTICLYGIK